MTEPDAFRCLPVFRRDARVKNLFTRNGAYYLRATVAGKHFMRASPYQDLEPSIRWAKAMIAKAKARRGDSLAETKAHSEYVTITDLLTAYKAAAAQQFLVDGKPSARTAARNATTLLQVVREIRSTESPGAFRIDILTPELLDGYTRARVQAAGTDELRIQRARISAAGMVRMAKSVFARWTEPYYRRAGIQIPPAIVGFLRTGKSFRPPQYQARPAALVEKTHTEAALLATSSPGLWAAYLLCYRFGLRAGEAAEARWTWIEQDHAGQPALRICRRADWKGPKNLVDHSIPATPDTWAALRAGQGDSPYILHGANWNQRYNVVTRDLAGWMRTAGWDPGAYPKAAHELRKLAGCVWLKGAGLAWAATWLGDNPTTVAHYYAAVMGSGTAVAM